jgi:hypothetical protein
VPFKEPKSLTTALTDDPKGPYRLNAVNRLASPSDRLRPRTRELRPLSYSSCFCRTVGSDISRTSSSLDPMIRCAASDAMVAFMKSTIPRLGG